MRKYSDICFVCFISLTSFGPNIEDKYCKFDRDHQIYCDFIEVGKYQISIFQNRLWVYDSKINEYFGIPDVFLKESDIDTEEKMEHLLLNYQLMK